MPAGLARGVLEHDHVADRARVLEQLDRVLGGLGRRDDPQVDHQPASPATMGWARYGARAATPSKSRSP